MGRPARQGADMDILAQRQAALLDGLPAERLGVASTIQAELAVQRKQAMDAMLEALDSSATASWSAWCITGAAIRRSPPPPTRHLTRFDSAIKEGEKVDKRLSEAVAAATVAAFR